MPVSSGRPCQAKAIRRPSADTDRLRITPPDPGRHTVRSPVATVTMLIAAGGKSAACASPGSSLWSSRTGHTEGAGRQVRGGTTGYASVLPSAVAARSVGPYHARSGSGTPGTAERSTTVPASLIRTLKAPPGLNLADLRFTLRGLLH